MDTVHQLIVRIFNDAGSHGAVFFIGIALPVIIALEHFFSRNP